MVTLGDPWADSPEPSYAWTMLDDDERLRAVEDILQGVDDVVQVESARANGDVVLSLEPMAASERGILLRDIEAILKALDIALIVYLNPKGDLNSLRRLRGVEVKE